MIENNDVIKRGSLAELALAWEKSSAQIVEGFASIVAAQDRLREFFGGDSYVFNIDTRHGHGFDSFAKPAATVDHLKRSVWKILMDRMELRKVMSLDRLAAMDKQIAEDKNIPEISYANLLAMVDQNRANMGGFLQEKIFEVYEWLRPRPDGWVAKKYVTNQKSLAAGVGAKVILPHAVRPAYHGGGFEVAFGHYQDRIRALDQVFHLLAGERQAEDYYGDLAKAIKEQTAAAPGGAFESKFFKGRAFGNGNLHLVFKRADLLGKFNLIAGGARLPAPAVVG